MKLITYTYNDSTRIGGLRGDEIIDLHASDVTIPDNMFAVLQAGDEMMGRINTIIEGGTSTLSLNEVKLESPITNPQKILAVGLNYRTHIDEVPESLVKKRNGKEVTVPIIFNKQASAVNGPYDPVALPAESTELDYEAELAVVIGRSCRRVRKADAYQVIAGYTILNDFTIRDWQRATPTMTMGKSWDTHCPMGPALVTPDEITDPHNLNIQLTVNGETRQNFNTGLMLHNIPTLINHLSTAFTLYPGDIIATGTSSGVGAFLNGGTFLQIGDVVRIEIEKIGHIENLVVADDKTYIR